MPTEFGGLIGLALKTVGECEPEEAKRGEYCGANSMMGVCSRHAAIAAALLAWGDAEWNAAIEKAAIRIAILSEEDYDPESDWAAEIRALRRAP